MYEVWAYGDNDMLFGIFNAVAAMVGGDSYIAALGIAGVCGGLTAGIVYALAPSQFAGPKWVISVFLVYMCLLVPKVTVGIVDKLGGQPVMMVANVPAGLGVFAGLSSAVGNLLTELFEGTLQLLPGPGQLPPELSYQRHGVLFGDSLIKRQREVVFSDAGYRTDMINFLANCTQFDLSDGTLNPTDFENSQNIWAMMVNTNPARFTNITAGTGESVLVPCPQGYLSLEQRRPVVLGDMYNTLASQLNPDVPTAQAQTIAAGQITTANQRANLANAASDAAAILMQNAMINAVNDASGVIGQKINDPASLLLSYGRAQSVIQTNAAWINAGKMAEQSLPLIRNSIEAIIYALFPLVMLMMLLTHGRTTMKMLQSYLFVMLWIQMWPAVYAILNYMATLASFRHITAAALIPGSSASGMTLSTAQLVYSNVLLDSAVVGYLVTAVPIIAWAAVKNMEGITQSAFGAVGGLTSTTTSQASASAAIGNMQTGNMSIDQQMLGPTRTSAFMNRMQDDVTGHTHAWNILSGTGSVDLLQNSGPISRSMSASASSSMEASANKSVEVARNEAVATMRERSALLADAVVHGRSSVDSTRLAAGHSRQEAADLTQNVQDVNSIIKSVAKNTGYDENIVANTLFQAALNAGGRLGVGYSDAVTLNRAGKGAGSSGPSGSDTSTATASTGTALGLNASATQQQTYSSRVDRTYNDVLNHIDQQQLGKFKSFADHYAHDETFQHALAADDRDAEDRSARMSQNLARTERAEAALSERESYAQGVRFGTGEQDVVSFDILRNPESRAKLLEMSKKYAGSPRAALIETESFMAANALARTPANYTDGTHVNWGRQAVSAVYGSAKNAPSVNPNIPGEYARFKAETGAHVLVGVEGGELGVAVDHAIGSNMGAINAAGQSQRAATETAHKNFNEMSGIVTQAPDEPDFKGVGNPDGTLVTKRILSKDTNEMALEDGKQSAENLVHGLGELEQKAEAAGKAVWEKAKKLME
jgi:conjugal transfer mating pair stabilization protein TraG